MKKFKRGKYLFGSLLVFAFVTTLLLNLKQENEIGDINNYTPIALLEDAIVYNYINDDDALVIGYYDIASKKQSDVICENGFYISSGLPAVIDNSVILPVTLNTNEHKLMKINADSNTSEMIFNEFNSYPIDSVATMNTGIYMLSSKKDNSTATSYIRKYTPTSAQALEMPETVSLAQYKNNVIHYILYLYCTILYCAYEELTLHQYSRNLFYDILTICYCSLRSQ